VGATRKFGDRIAQAMLPVVGAGYLRFVRATMRLTREGAESALPADGRPVIYCFWHEQLAMMPWVQFRPPTVVPISASRDGDYTTGIFRRLGVEPTRGSSSRAGASAARGLITAARAGRDLGITLDGPRGPARVIQPGATWVARATGAALLPAAFACSRYRRIGSWDRMVIPLPFSRGVFVYGEHLYIPRDATRESLIGADEELARRVEQVTKRAETILLT
jgi:lysophospholipid acyltransferase (LPLAT)-like uncharacterized protein